ncbi:hypothetical protein EVU96_25020 [Bacillus infantis]|uniref:hypothetical protein n=1 Tax=Bacillus infantis TaxID=324767 RepID=UPI00101D95A3|nr:hypothetical protein [Bacillus infantis]RYI25078.1 hypothetical protein EVU96_25020 [Bacillus infantis]
MEYTMFVLEDYRYVKEKDHLIVVNEDFGEEPFNKQDEAALRWGLKGDSDYYYTIMPGSDIKVETGDGKFVFKREELISFMMAFGQRQIAEW